MFVELVFDKRNVSEPHDAAEIIKAVLTMRMHRIVPDVDVRVKPIHAARSQLLR